MALEGDDDVAGVAVEVHGDDHVDLARTLDCHVIVGEMTRVCELA